MHLCVSFDFPITLFSAASCERGKPLRREGREEVFLLVCYDPGRGIQDQNIPSPDGQLSLQVVYHPFDAVFH